MTFDVARVRGLFPALGDGWVHLDTPAGMQVPEQVAAAVSTALRAPISGPGGTFPASWRAEAMVTAARGAVADLVGIDPKGVVLGPSVAVLLQRLADVLGETWTVGDEVVVSRLDDPRNVVPWQRAVQRAGGTLRWGEIDIETCELPAWQYEDLINERTKLVAVTAASDVVGTRTDLPLIAETVHTSEALVVVDASAAAPFVPLDMTSMGADVVAVSANAWGGPPVAALAFADPALLDRLPSCALNPHARGAERLELGPYAYPMFAGLVASVDYLAELNGIAVGPRRERLLAAMKSMDAYQFGLMESLIGDLRMLLHVTVIGDPVYRVPTLAFTVSHVKPVDVVAHLAENGLCAFADDGQHGVFNALGAGEVGGAVRCGLAHYTTAAELDMFVRVLAELG